MPQARDFRIFDRSWLGLFSLFQNAQNVDRWDISRPVLEKKGSMFTLFRIAFQLIPIQKLRNIWPLSKSHQSPTGWRFGQQCGGAENLVACPILKKQSWSLLCSRLTVHRGNTHAREGALLSLYSYPSFFRLSTTLPSYSPKRKPHMVVDQVSPRSDKTHISGKLTLQQKQIGCHSKLSATLERDTFQVCQSLETWPMIALESLLSRGYFLAQLSLFVKSVDKTFSYFGSC